MAAGVDRGSTCSRDRWSDHASFPLRQQTVGQADVWPDKRRSGVATIFFLQVT